MKARHESGKQDEHFAVTDSTNVGLAILKAGVGKIINRGESNKTPDHIPSELLKLLDDQSINFLTVLFNRTYHSRQIPED